jgi:hypothetical protein
LNSQQCEPGIQGRLAQLAYALVYKLELKPQ